MNRLYHELSTTFPRRTKFSYTEIHFDIVRKICHPFENPLARQSIFIKILILSCFAVAIELISQHLMDILKDGKRAKSTSFSSDHVQRSRPH